MALGPGRTINVGQLVARIVFRGNTAALEAAQTRIGGLRAGLQSLSPALLAAGTAITGLSALSLRSFVDFERNLTRLRTQVGLSAEETASLARGFHALAGEFGVGATEISGAYFAIASAGLRGESATETLRTALQLAAADYGDLDQVVRSLIPTLNAYSSVGLTASDAGNLLASAVSAGNFEARQLAPALSQVISVAAAANVELDEVLQAFAQASQVQPNLNRVATQLLQLFNVIGNPSAQAEEILDRLGLTVEDLQARVRADFLGTLVSIRTEFGLSDQELRQFLGSVEAAQGLLNVTGAGLDATTERFMDAASGVGALNRSTGILSDTLGFRLRQSTARIQSAMIQLGDSLAPVVSAFLDELQPVLQTFSAAMARGDPLVRNLTLGIAGLGVALLGLRALLFVLTPLMWAWRAVTIAVSAATWALAGLYRLLRLALLGLRGVMIGLRVAMLALTAATWAQTAAVAALQLVSLGWVGLAIVGVLALIAVIALLVIYWDEVTAAIRAAGEAVGGFFGSIGDVIGNVLTNASGAVNDALAAADFATNIDLAYSGAGYGGRSSSRSSRVSNTRVDQVNITVDGAGRNADDVATEVADRFQREISDVYANLGDAE